MDKDVICFMDRIQRVNISYAQWYAVLLDFKTAAINNYINRHVDYENRLRDRLRTMKNRRITQEFYDDVLPYIQDIIKKKRYGIAKERFKEKRRQAK